MNLLTENQTNDLHHAIHSYLTRSGYRATANAFAAESGVNSTQNESVPLEKKWLVILRLQRKVLELKRELKALKEKTASSYSNSSQFDSLLLRIPNRTSLVGHRGAVLSAFPSNTFLVTGSEDSTVRIWSSTQITQSEHLTSQKSYDTQTEQTAHEVFPQKTLTGHSSAVTSVIVMTNQNLIVSSSLDCSIILWEKSGRKIQEVKEHNDSVTSLSVISDTHFLSTSKDGTVRIWAIDMSNDPKLTPIASHTFEEAVLCSDSFQNIIALGFKKRIVFVSAETCSVLCETSLPIHIEAICFINQTTLCVALRDSLIRVIDVKTGFCSFLLDGHTNWVRSLIHCGDSEDGFLFSTADDKTIKMWRMSDRVCIQTIKDPHEMFIRSLAISYPNYLISTSDDNTAKIWEILQV